MVVQLFFVSVLMCLLTTASFTGARAAGKEATQEPLFKEYTLESAHMRYRLWGRVTGIKISENKDGQVPYASSLPLENLRKPPFILTFRPTTSFFGMDDSRFIFDQDSSIMVSFHHLFGTQSPTAKQLNKSDLWIGELSDSPCYEVFNFMKAKPVTEEP